MKEMRESREITETGAHVSLVSFISPVSLLSFLSLSAPTPMKTFIVASSPNAVEPDGLRPQSGDLVIAADGGANWCVAWGWLPDLVVGDMDSVDAPVAEQLRSAGVPFVQHPVEKDETDLELALRAAIDRGADEIIVAAALGGRIDHTLGNLALLALPLLANVQVRMVDGGQSIALVRQQLTVAGAAGDTLSLIPFGGDARDVSVVGVRWPLDDADLPVGPSLGISNRLIGPLAEVTVRAGALLVVHVRAGSESSSAGCVE